MGVDISSLTADAVIQMLDLKPHPEGGYYKETFRDRKTNQGGRAASTAIYFLLRCGESSRWHRIDAVEIWHWYAGAVLQLEIVDSDKSCPKAFKLGSINRNGERPQEVVPPGCWQRARTMGDWTLVGCTVAPGFEFSGFEIASDDLLPTDWS